MTNFSSELAWPLASSSWDKLEVNAMQDVISSGLFSMGKVTKEFEKKFASWSGRKHAVMVNSGSSANLIAAAAMRYVRDQNFLDSDGFLGEVIVPAVSWSTSFFPFFQNQYKLVFVDVDPTSFNINIDALKNAVSEKTRGICGVNLLGNPANWQEIKKIAKENKLWTVEDNCESMGAESEFGRTGTFGDVSTFSFFYSHHISTMEGGMVVCDDEDLYDALRALRAHGWARETPLEREFLGQSRSSGWQEYFRFYLPGYNVRPLELSAAVGLRQLEKFPGTLTVRRDNARKLKKVLNRNNSNWVLQNAVQGSSWFTFGFINTHPERANTYRDNLVQLLEKNRIQSRPIVAGDFTRNPVFEIIKGRISGTLEGARIINDAGLMIGNHHFDLSANFEVLLKLLNESEIL